MPRIERMAGKMPDLCAAGGSVSPGSTTETHRVDEGFRTVSQRLTAVRLPDTPPGGGSVDFDDLFQRLYPSLFRYLHRLTGDADVAEDIAQEAFVRLLKQPLPEEEVRPWLFTVAMNLVRDRARRAERRLRLLSTAPPLQMPSVRPDDHTEKNERIEGVRAALEQLSERDRQLLLMREEGFKYEEIAGVIGVAPASVGTLIARALRRFVKAYRGENAANDARS
ncbi:MAG: sigma-70 family RNA polymerase sigma factor [Gemmatimonadetes bacterium]|nr:sigma-70 family RNA polymerase sigma factor [Gemmatimonadota bacterium]